MNITNNSYNLMNSFSRLNCINTIKQTNVTNNIFKGLFKDIMICDAKIRESKLNNPNKQFYNRQHQHITKSSDIPKPKTFTDNSFPTKVRKHINEKSSTSITYSINIFDRDITINFITEKRNITLKKYDTYVDNILIWLYIVNKYADKKCANALTLYFYQTNLLKELPTSNIESIDQIHANTAFTRTCQTNAEIVIFRNEEWFKVFLHETMHTFGLDFSGIDNHYCTKTMLSLFNVTSDVNLYEAYTEFWARIMNVLFCSYNHFKSDNISKIPKMSEHIIYEKLNEFASHFMNIEIKYSFFQMVKILDFMDLKYEDISNKNQQIRSKYKENTNVLAYYVITTILINNYQLFLGWCQKNNTSLLQFGKGVSEQEELCKFIYSKYKNKQLLEAVKCTEQILDETNKMMKNKNTSKNNILNSLRMSVCELG